MGTEFFMKTKPSLFSRGYTKLETTIVRGQNMQICHSLRCKQIDMWGKPMNIEYPK